MTPNRHGFTLIEVLAVTALLGLIGSVLVGGGLHTNTHGAATLLRQMSRWEASLRDLARERGGCMLALDDAGTVTGQSLAGLTLPLPISPPGILGCLDSSGQTLRNIHIDLNGFSQPHSWLVTAPDQERLILVVDGLSGLVSRGASR